MANTSSAKRALRVSERNRVYNTRRANALKKETKRIKKLVAEGGLTEAKATLPNAYKAIDKAAKRGIIKKNTAARKKSHLARTLNNAASARTE